MTATENQNSANVELNATAEIVASYVLNHKVEPTELANLINNVYKTVSSLTEKSGARNLVLAGGSSVSAEESITPDYIVCLEDGKKLKMLKRYLKKHYNMSPEEYRKRWNLPATYPMVAPNYAKRRSQLAKDIGLGKHSLARRKTAALGKAKNPLRMVRTETHAVQAAM